MTTHHTKELPMTDYPDDEADRLHELAGKICDYVDDRSEECRRELADLLLAEAVALGAIVKREVEV